MEASINERVAKLEVMVTGNGKKGLMDKVDEHELRFNNVQTKEGCKMVHETLLDSINEIKNDVKLIKEQRNKERHVVQHVFSWLLKAGPLLTGLAALLAILLKK